MLDSVDLTAGGYLFGQTIAYAEDRALPTVTGARVYGGGKEDHEVQGLFAQGDWHATLALTLTSGLRYSHESKSAAITYVRTRPACDVVARICPIEGTKPPAPRRAQRHPRPP